MGKITTISWTMFLILLLLLFVIWLLTTRTKIGKAIIIKETHWNIPQWSRLLMVMAFTFFILINPIVHLLAFAIFFVLYFFIVPNPLFKNRFREQFGFNESLNVSNPFISPNNKNIQLVCKSTSPTNLITERKALDKCLFSFPQINNFLKPEVSQIDEEYHLTLRLSSDEYLSSLMSYIRKSGFEVQIKK